jgi:hypothetical protein
VKFERTDSFTSDWRRLSDAERELFRSAIKHFHVAAERIVADLRVHWPGSPRIKRVVSAPRIGEMTWWFTVTPGGQRVQLSWARAGAAITFSRCFVSPFCGYLRWGLGFSCRLYLVFFGDIDGGDPVMGRQDG